MKGVTTVNFKGHNFVALGQSLKNMCLKFGAMQYYIVYLHLYDYSTIIHW